jgi:hypothetical protein
MAAAPGSSKAEIAGRIDDMFIKCTASTGVADLKSVVKVFWPILDNKVSLVDIAGVFTMCVPSNGNESLDLITFVEFFNGIARVKYSSGADFCEKLLAELADSAGIKIKADQPLFQQAMDKAVVRTLLKHDLSLRRAFASFAGQNINVGGGLTWDEVQRLSLGMEVAGFTSFAGAHSLIPGTLSLHKCETLARDVMSQFPLNASHKSLHTALLFPQFQLLMCFTAVARYEALNKRAAARPSAGFAKKVVEADARPLQDMISDLIRDLGLGTRTGDNSNVSEAGVDEMDPFLALPADSRRTHGTSIAYPGKVVLPSQQRPENMYTGTISHSRHAQLLRLDALFEEVQAQVLKLLETGSDVLVMLSAAPPIDEAGDRAAAKLSSKPVVIGDAVPVPAVCPEPVEQLLQAALAHHNLGSYEEALKFLEAARMQLEDIAARVTMAALPAVEPEEPEEADEEDSGDDSAAKKIANNGRKAAAVAKAPEPTPIMAPAVKASIPLDLELYITLCKGNVYQSCGDDEQSLLHYMDGWDRATAEKDPDWEIVCLNSIGMLAYYSLRFDVALMCFGAVAAYRMRAYGINSADTATAWNNEGCCMYCLGRRGESRLRFEKGWAVMCKVLGHRAPRSVTSWKNLEKSRRAAASHKPAEGLALRPDIDRLVLGGTFMVNALPPPEEGGKKKSAGGGGKKKKKK